MLTVFERNKINPIEIPPIKITVATIVLQGVSDYLISISLVSDMLRKRLDFD